MKNFYFLLVAFLFFGFAKNSEAQTAPSLQILNPQKQWQKKQGTIESATFSVRPKGIYMECGLYLTFSTRGFESFFSDDTLEIVLKFSLPETAIVHDSWLWIGDEIARGKILDRWTASQIYEGIVKRRQDPSILTKDSKTDYTLRVYPLPKNETRRVKITYLLPVDWSRKQVKLAIPGTLANVSFQKLQKFNVLVWPGDIWKNLNLDGTQFEEIPDSSGSGNVWKTELAPDLFTTNPSISFDSPMKNGVFVAASGDSTGGVYQLAMLPTVFLPEQKPVKLAVIFDYEYNATDGNFLPIFLKTKAELKNALSPNDSFNLFFSNLIIQPFKPNWIAGDDATIDQIFNSITNPSGGYPQLPALMGSAIQFIKNKGGSGQIMLVTNTASFPNLNAANDLTNDVLAAISPEKIPVHAIDFRKNNTPYFLAGGNYYYANSYVLGNLAKQTGGSYFNIRENGGVDKIFPLGFGSIGNRIENFELTTSLANGFCFGRFSPGNSTQIITSANQPVLQIGKYKGQFPFKFSISGELDGQFFYKTKEIADAEIYPSDSLNREMWYGNFIQLLERETATNSVVSQILFNSLSERVLSKYTAFLCLEDTTTYCDECLDETQFTATDPVFADSLVKIYPNPFVDFVKIEIRDASFSAGKISMEIFNAAGQLTKILDVETQTDGATAIWRGENSNGEKVAAGVFVVLIKTQNQSRAVKIVKRGD